MRSEESPISAVPKPVGVTDSDYHCPNCLFIEDETGGFWACQNLCVRD